MLFYNDFMLGWWGRKINLPQFLMSSEKQSPIQIKVSASLKRKFEVKCKENGKTITVVLKELMESYITDDGSEQEQDTLADADLQQLKDELYSLQSKVQSLDEEVQTNKDDISPLKRGYIKVASKPSKELVYDIVYEKLQEHHNGLMKATKQYTDKQVSELKQMLETSNNNTLPDAQAEDNDGDG